VQEVVEELTSNLRGQRVHVTPFTGKRAVPFSQLADDCRAEGHLAIGVQRGGVTKLNVASDFGVEQGDKIITIGAERLPARG